MKTILSVLGLSIIILSCNLVADNESVTTESENIVTTEEEGKAEVEEISNDSIIYRGDIITADGAISTTELLTLMADKTDKTTKIEAVINSCCQKKGCWMKVDLGNDEEMRVTFKDYAFFVPKNSAGSKVIMEGKAYYDTTEVDMLRHYAEDAGKTEEEINAITEPKLELLFESTGLIIYPNL